jgi:hypothetical protein
VTPPQKCGIATSSSGPAVTSLSERGASIALVLMKSLLIVLLALSFSQSARADGCAKSLDYILNNFAGELQKPSTTYRLLLDVCARTLPMANVREAYLLRDGGIAVVPKNNSVFATASTLADFCRKFPNNTLRFVTRKEVQHGLTTGFVVMLSSGSSTPCQKIMGEK